MLPPLAWLGIALALLPIPVKRIFLVGEPDVVTWLLWDYGIRVVMLLGVALIYDARAMGASPARAGLPKSILVFFVMLAVQYFAIANVDLALRRLLPPYFEYFASPLIHDRYLLVLDLTLGIMLVAVSEELVFRRTLFSLLDRSGLGKLSILFLSSAVFALFHMTSGVSSLVVVFLDGLVFGAAFLSTGRLSVCIALHYIEDLWVFGSRALENGALGPATFS